MVTLKYKMYWSQLRFLFGTVFLFNLKLVPGKAKEACNCACSLQNNTVDMCKSIRDLNERADTFNLYSTSSFFHRNPFTVQSEVNRILDKRIKNYLDAEEAHDQEEVRNIEEILEFLCPTIFGREKGLKIEGPSLFKKYLWTMCSEKFGFQKPSVRITYKELRDLKATCPGQDSCGEIRKSDSLIEYNCQCGKICSTLDTCCFDSPYRGLSSSDGPSQSCQKVHLGYGLAVFMVDRCPTNGTAGDDWKTLCERGEEGNLMTYVPVTSTVTNLTYKNYYCFACHETTDDYYIWKVMVHSRKKLATLDNGNPILFFDSEYSHRVEQYCLTTFIDSSWWAQNIDGLKNESVFIRVKIPSEIEDIVTECRLDDVISKCCDDWQDDVSKNKCAAYTSLIVLLNTDVHPYYRLYKNPHCAVCNFELLNSAVCNYIKPGVFSTSRCSSTAPYDTDIENVIKSYFNVTNYFTLHTK